jgi:hypothetical protein
MWALSVIFKVIAKVNNHPLGNLVILTRVPRVGKISQNGIFFIKFPKDNISRYQILIFL